MFMEKNFQANGNVKSRKEGIYARSKVVLVEEFVGH